jgi:hypothetical protein
LFDALKSHRQFELSNALAGLLLWATFMPLSALVQFPSFWWMPVLRSGIQKLMPFGFRSEKGAQTDDRYRRFESVVIYSKKFRNLKWIVWVFTCLYCLVLVSHLYAFQVVNTNTFLELAETAIRSLLRFKAGAPVLTAGETVPFCYTKPRGLTLTQCLALAADAYFEKGSNESSLLQRSYFAVSASSHMPLRTGSKVLSVLEKRSRN